MAYTRFETARRTAARTALYSSLVLTALAIGLFHSLVFRPIAADRDVDYGDTDWEADPAVRLLQQYVRVPSHRDGDEYAAALWLSGPLEAAGIAVHIERIGPRQANLWADLPGAASEPLVLLDHLDVEPIPMATDWEYPPFSGVVAPPLIHGRGTFDMKSYTIAHLLGMLDAAALPTPPARSLRLLATAEEESGSELGLLWILREHPELLESAWAVLTEGGVIETRAPGDLKYWAIETTQPRRVQLQTCASSRERLDQFREDLIEYRFASQPIRLTEGNQAFLEAYRASRDRQNLRDLLEDLDRLARDPARLADLPVFLQLTLRDEVLVSEPEWDGETWTQKVTLYLLEGSDPETALQSLVPEWIQAGIRLYRTSDEITGGASPATHPAYEELLGQLRSRTSPESAGPFVLLQSKTDARFLRPRGIPTYGWTPFPLSVTLTLRAGHEHEKIDLSGYTEGIRSFRAILPHLIAK